MDLTEILRLRRSIRTYAAEPVEEAKIAVLLDAAVHAPSAMNVQPWGFAVVQDKGRLKRYSDMAKELLLERMDHPKSKQYEGMLRDPEFNIFYDANTLIVICATARGTYTDADCWLAAENLLLAACNEGLGSCCIGFAVPVLNTETVKRELNIPAAGAAVAPVIVGYPRGEATFVTRSAPKILSWIR